eukprot:COSAG02_NODE_2268_length_9281_cov_8.820518_4_plen_69_part_00
MSAEAYRVVARSLRRYSWSLNAFGVFWQCTPQTITVISGHIVVFFIFMVISGRFFCNVVNPGCRVSMW